GWGDLDFAPRERVIEQADFLSLHCVLTPETRGLLSAEAIARMKPSAIVVNVSRGALIDQMALVEALAGGRLAAAGLDVFVEEPLERDNPLHRLGNVVLSPHLAFYTTEAYERLEHQCFTAVRDLLAGKTPPNVKNAAMLGAGADAMPRKADPIEEKPRTTEDWQWTEGDINLSPQRTKWLEEQIDAPTRDLLERDARAFLHQSLSTPCLNALAECEGSYLVDEQGRRYLDFHGNSAHQIGYRHPHVIAAIKEQLDTLPFCPRRFTNRPAIAVAEKLGELAPGRLSKVLLAPGGTSAIGIALKIARYATGRYKTISMWDSFHGASLDAISIGGEEFFRGGLGPLLPGCFHVDWPRAESDADAIEKILVEQGDVAAVVAEPMRCTTVDRPPDAYWQRVRALCDQYGALLVFDEIPTALGRTGRWFCCENSGVVPDLLVIGKGLGGGVMPMAAVIARDDLDVVADRALGHYTHEKSTTGAAAALATIDVIESEQLLDHAQQLGKYALERLQRIERELAIVSDARGVGLALALELACEPEQGQQVLYACLEQGVSFKVSSGNVLTLTPPLTITRDEMDQALDVVEKAVASL
ncbi:MAG: (R)-1-hydroxy-2-aminoethylphosphonate ammonia-lyase, partial [Aeoliella sp.]